MLSVARLGFFTVFQIKLSVTGQLLFICSTCLDEEVSAATEEELGGFCQVSEEDFLR